ncbi:MAG: hypothetical protein KJ970_00895 [Candidatus Eisenbacteria bacterium]|uniref:Uncharacterized protein n=1 Tax=Eiseniibacteriota bacterium TaxID=2212470 RepID=A0A948RTU8_UNCEI|nr:hypothetical protein [Candidatus Eisenbacteria bacterium]MBU1950596.1 hypothetical protein [Candidatus Eisenbacteria bacterium]MBU2689458.1 hypothetical protein [Candidatus Eisenbacteria bacterium]
MRGHIRIILAVGLLVAISTTPLAAVPPPHPLSASGGMKETEQVLLQTDRVIERARDLVRDAGSIQRTAVAIQAEAFMDRAQQSQRDAWGDFRRQRWAQAANISLKAREYALKAIELSQVEFKAHESLVTLLEQTREMAVEAKAEIRESGRPEAIQWLQTAEDQLRRAQEAYRETRLRQSIRFAVVARDLIRRALDASRGSGPDEVGRVRSDLEQTDGLLLEVEASLREGLGGSDLQTMVQRAKEVQDRSWRAYRDGKPKQASRLTNIARERALAVLLHLQAAPDPQDLQASLNLLSSLYESIQSAAASVDDESIRQLLLRGREHLLKAEREMAAGKIERALNEARASEALLREASERIPSP